MPIPQRCDNLNAVNDRLNLIDIDNHAPKEFKMCFKIVGNLLLKKAKLIHLMIVFAFFDIGRHREGLNEHSLGIYYRQKLDCYKMPLYYSCC